MYKRQAGNSPEHLLKMTIALAELSSLLSEYEVSNRYVVEGIRQARDMGNKRAEAKLLFCMGENKRWLSFKKDAYETFDAVSYTHLDVYKRQRYC